APRGVLRRRAQRRKGEKPRPGRYRVHEGKTRLAHQLLVGEQGLAHETAKVASCHGWPSILTRGGIAKRAVRVMPFRKRPRAKGKAPPRRGAGPLSLGRAAPLRLLGGLLPAKRLLFGRALACGRGVADGLRGLADNLGAEGGVLADHRAAHVVEIARAFALGVDAH